MNWLQRRFANGCSLFVAIALIATVPAFAQLSGTYTINPVGGNYTSISAAVTALTTSGVSGAVTFNIAPATYNESVTIPAITGASAANTITFNGTNMATCIVSYSTVQYGAVFTLNGADYVRIQNLTINATGASYGYGILLTNAADYNQISGCTINIGTTTNSDNVGILAAGTTGYSSTNNSANYTLVQNNTITGGYYGIRFNGTSSTVLCSNNTIQNNNVTGFYYYGVYMYYQSYALVTGNTITDRRGTTSSYGIYMTYNRYGSSITKNKVNSGYMGIYVAYCNYDSTTRGSVTNNMVVVWANSTNYGLRMYYSYMYDIQYNSFNLLSLSSTAYGLSLYNSTSNPNMHHDVRNNTIRYAGTSTSYPIYIYTPVSPIGFVNLDYNNCYSPNSVNTYYMAGTTYTTLTSLQTAFPTYFQHNKEANPEYDTDENLHTTSANLDGAGTPIAGITTDIDGDTRNATTPDIGADEFTPPTLDLAFDGLVSPGGKCSYTNAEAVTVRLKNKTLIPYSASVNPVTINLTIAGPIPQNISGTISTGTLAANATGTFTLTSTANLSSLGVYTITGSLTMTGDQNSTNNALAPVTITPEAGISTFPYTEDFEATNGNWTPVQVSGSNNTWAWGVPNYPNSGYQAMQTAHSGTKVWMTGLTTGYVASEDNAMTSPCLDFTTLTHPVFTFWMFYCLEDGWDGVVIEISTDVGTTWTKLTPYSPPYNSTSTSGPIAPPKYSGTTAALGWNKYVFDLTAYAGRGGIKLRIHFGSDGSGQYGGVAIDDIAIGDFYEKDLAITHVQYNYAPDTWARIVTKQHVIEADVTNTGFEANPTSITAVYKMNSMPADEMDGIAQIFTPVWNGSKTTLTFSTPHVPAAEGPLTAYVRVFYTGDGNTVNNVFQSMPVVKDIKTFGYENFDIVNPPKFDKNWVVNNVNGNEQWTVGTVNGVGGSSCVSYPGGASAADDWVFTPGALLGAGSSYALKFKYRSRSGSPQILDVAYGTSADPASMTVFASFSGFTNTSYIDALGIEGVAPYFNTPNLAQNYYVGFHVRSAGNAGALDIDDIHLLENPTPPPKLAYGDGVTFIDNPLVPITFSAVYKKSGMLVRTYTVVNSTGKYGNPPGDFLWDVNTSTAWIKLTKSVPDPLTFLASNPFRPEWARQNQTFTIEIDPSNMVPGLFTGSISLDGYLYNIDYPSGIRASNTLMVVPVQLTIVGTGGTGQQQNASATFTGLSAAGSPYEYRDQSGNLFATVSVVSGVVPSMTITSYPGQLPRYISRYRYVKHYWVIDAPGTGWVANVQFHYFDSEVGSGSVADENALRGMRIAPKTSFWEDPINGTTSTPNAMQNFVLVTNINPANYAGMIAVAHDWTLTAPTKSSAGSIPSSVVLDQNFPNPFNPSTTLSFGIPEEMQVTLTVTNSAGEEVARLVEAAMEPGMYTVQFDGTELPSGMYLYTLRAGDTVQTKTMLLNK